jgi:predicted tellurium resistance membrane protein TerC/Mg2+/Co2+ transporter CorC
MELLLDPSVWVGLLTLVVLEIVLGIDNLIFIAILADKLPPDQRDKARIAGLSLALVMRLILLSAISWMFHLTAPLFHVGGMPFSGRDLILILGGFFLVFKGTMEMHERVEGRRHASLQSPAYASFGVIVTQIVVLDAVFSLDAVITAVGMVEHLEIMMAAVVIAIGVMLFASKPLTRFVNAHPTVVILCLGFLLMIGFSLVAEGFGFKVPKGYLYAAIGFSVIIELLNQLARRNLLLMTSSRPMRERTAEAVLRMLGKRGAAADPADGAEEDPATIREKINRTPHGFYPVCRGSLDEMIGIGRAKDLIADLIVDGKVNEQRLRPPLIVHETIRMLDLIHTLKSARGQLVIVINEFGTVEGLVTPMDVFEAIAGDFPDEDETPDIIAKSANQWIVEGGTDLHHFEQTLDIEGFVQETDDFSTVAGFLLQQLGRLPEVGDTHTATHGPYELRFRVIELDGRRIAKVFVERALASEDMPAAEAA